MPEAGPVLICASCVAMAAGLTQLLRPGCPLASVSSPDRVVTDGVWGILENLGTENTPFGDEFTATENIGRHRVLRSMIVTAPGRYRVSIDTRYRGTAHMAIEAGGPHQSYGIVTVNLKNGLIDKVDPGTLAAGVETAIGQTGIYRWWIEMALKPGEFDYNFALLSAYGGPEFPGTGICKFALSNPTVRRVDGLPEH